MPNDFSPFLPNFAPREILPPDSDVPFSKSVEFFCFPPLFFAHSESRPFWTFSTSIGRLFFHHSPPQFFCPRAVGFSFWPSAPRSTQRYSFCTPFATGPFCCLSRTNGGSPSPSCFLWPLSFFFGARFRGRSFFLTKVAAFFPKLGSPRGPAIFTLSLAKGPAVPPPPTRLLDLQPFLFRPHRPFCEVNRLFPFFFSFLHIIISPADFFSGSYLCFSWCWRPLFFYPIPFFRLRPSFLPWMG